MEIEKFYDYVVSEVNKTDWQIEGKDESKYNEYERVIIDILDSTTFTKKQIKWIVNFDESIYTPRSLYYDPEITWEQKMRWLRHDLYLSINFNCYRERLGLVYRDDVYQFMDDTNYFI